MMGVEEAVPGARIIERANACAHPRTIKWLSIEGDEVMVHVKNDGGRSSKIRARNLVRYDLIKDSK